MDNDTLIFLLKGGLPQLVSAGSSLRFANFSR